MNTPLKSDDFLGGKVLLVDKPLGWTSFDVVNKLRYSLRKSFHIKKIKVGHAGTLDPLATGLLIICTGKATKQIESFMGLEKEYTGTFSLGKTTLSYDAETAVDATFPTQHISEDVLLKTTQKFLGEIQQIPPIFSAIKKGGKTAYKEARKGKDLKLDARPVHISEFEITKIEMPEVGFRVKCSKGTYIRSLAFDFGKALESGAFLSGLRRTKIGDYSIENAWPLDSLLQQIHSYKI